jgi:glutathione S-transferase
VSVIELTRTREGSGGVQPLPRPPELIELYQTEWCPASARVRERLTELGRDYVVRQVPVEQKARVLLLRETGSETIPTLVLRDGSAVIGEEAINSYLDRHFDDPPDAEAHRLKAAKARRRYLEEECECLQPATH